MRKDAVFGLLCAPLRIPTTVYFDSSKQVVREPMAYQVWKRLCVGKGLKLGK